LKRTPEWRKQKKAAPNKKPRPFWAAALSF